MTELKRRLSDIEGYAPPDLWKEITSGARGTRGPEPGPSWKPLMVALAFAISLAGLILLVRAFGVREPQPASKPPVTADKVTARVTARIDVGRATSVAYGAGSVWVSVVSGDLSDPSILRIDPASGETLATIPVPSVPGWTIGGAGIVVTEGSVWVAGGLDGPRSDPDGFITRIDPSTNRIIDTITLKEGDVADVATDGTAIWALIRGNPGQPSIVRIDPSSGQVIATISLEGGYGRYIFASDGSVLAAIVQPPGGPFDGGTLVRIDPSTNQVAGTYDLGAYPSVATGEGRLWAVTDRGLVQIDPATGEPAGVPAVVPCTGDALAVGAGGVWCFDPARDRALTRFNPQTGQVDLAMQADEGTGGTALTTSPGSIWVVNRQQLTRVDLEEAGSGQSELVRLELVPIPEGPPGPLFERKPSDPYALPMSLIEDLIPQPLPAPLEQGFSCEFGGNLVIDLANGDTITYGPCRRPPEIDRLWDQVVAVWRQAKSE